MYHTEKSEFQNIINIVKGILKTFLARFRLAAYFICILISPKKSVEFFFRYIDTGPFYKIMFVHRS